MNVDIAARASALLRDQESQIHRRTDALFAHLMVVQWLAGIVAALLVAPRTWIGTTSAVHSHVWAAIFLGGLISAVPIAMARLRPGEALTRHVIAAGQVLTSALLIHLTGGRIETHFHVFGSLAFLAFYRDPVLLVTPTLVVALDHGLRGMLWPQSVYGVIAASPWRWVEHTGWVAFEDVFLVISIVRARAEMRGIAERQAQLEATNATVERMVEDRTLRLSAESRINETLYRVGAAFARELDHKRLVQMITDEATALAGACFGAYFANLTDERGDRYVLFTLAGAPAAAFEGFPLPRATPIFGPTFRGERVVRFDDVTKEPEFGAWGPQPPGHLNVRSYLAVPVKSASGEVLGGIFLAHEEPGRFTEQHERIVVGLAAQAAIALENARLYDALKTSEETSIAALRRAAEADRRKDEFLAMLGHELRNPLAPIVTALQLMRVRGETAAEHERAVIERQVRHLVRLVDDLLDISRITRGMTQLERKPMELSAVVARAIEMASPLLEQRAHELAVDVPRTGALVLADEVRLAQVIANLLTNAAKFTQRGGHIRVSAACESQEVVLRVKDDGRGIAPELLPRIFEIFVQGERKLDRAEGGLGIGLTLVRSLVTLHGGTVSAHSDGEGKGSEFVVRLPVATVPPEQERLGIPSAPEPTRRRVLLVDDNADAVATLAQAVQTSKHEVVTAANGAVALEAAARFLPDVAVIDIGLPVIDGYELAKRMRELPGLAQVSLVAVTGYGQDHDRARARAAGFGAHFVKPVVLADLLRAIAEAPRPESVEAAR